MHSDSSSHVSRMKNSCQLRDVFQAVGHGWKRFTRVVVLHFECFTVTSYPEQFFLPSSYLPAVGETSGWILFTPNAALTATERAVAATVPWRYRYPFSRQIFAIRCSARAIIKSEELLPRVGGRCPLSSRRYAHPKSMICCRWCVFSAAKDEI